MQGSGEHGVGKGEQGVDRVGGRAAVAGTEVEVERVGVGGLVFDWWWAQQVVEGAEVACGGGAFDAEQALQILGLMDSVHVVLEVGDQLRG